MIDRLTEYFKQFPGIGERQARRFVYFLLSRNPNYVKELTSLITELKKNISQCKSCFRFYPADGKAECEICQNPEVDKTLLIVVEKDADLENIRKSGTYKGKFFVLGGLAPMIESDKKNTMRSRELLDRVEKQIKNDELKEIILAFSLNPQGEHTDAYIRRLLSPLTEKHKIAISSLGRGLSTGTELEYSDDETIKNALKNRG